MRGIEKERARERGKKRGGEVGGSEREKKQTSNNVTYMQSHTPFFFLLLVTMCTFLRREGARGGRKREGERERKEEGVRSEII